MDAADVDDGNLGIIELLGCWLARDDGAAMDGRVDADGETVVLLRAGVQRTACETLALSSIARMAARAMH